MTKEKVITKEMIIKKGFEIISKNIVGLKALGDWLDDMEVMIPLMKRDIFAYRYASPRIRANRNLAVRVLKVQGILLDSVAGDLNNNKQVVLTAVGNCGYALEYASEELQDDIDVVKTAIKKDPRSITFASPRLRKDKKLIRMAYEFGGPFLIERCAKNIRYNRTRTKI